MKKLKSISILFMLLIASLSFIECDNNEEITDNNNLVLSKKEQIKILKESLIHFKKRAKKVSKEDSYIENLKYLNDRLNTNLNFSEKEIKLIQNIKKDNSILSFENQKKNIEKIKKDGNYEIYLEAEKIIKEVYGNENKNIQARLSWSCAFAIAGNIGATIGLTACITGVGCPLAIAMKVVALGSLATC